MFPCPLDFVVINNVDSTHNACAEMEPPIAFEATQVENNMYQPSELTSVNAQPVKEACKAN